MSNSSLDTEFTNNLQKVSSKWTLRDHIGRILVRLGIHRNNYRVMPGLYSVGTPNAESPVFVSANYKLSFDHLRRGLEEVDGYILVLDTKGVNVWCAAGKGSFGTNELIRQIAQTKLKSIVSHKKLILPQLGAPGVSAHSVKQHSGFTVEYGPVHSRDLKEYVRIRRNGAPVPRSMRKVTFTLSERLELAPLEFVLGLKYLSIPLIILAVLGYGSFFPNYRHLFLFDAWLLFAAYVGGTILVPLFLPFLPGLAFSIKGAAVAIVILAVETFLQRPEVVQIVSLAPLVVSLTSFTAMNFTGSTTFTNLTGVEREMKIAVPVMIILAVSGIVLRVLVYGGILS